MQHRVSGVLAAISSIDPTTVGTFAVVAAATRYAFGSIALLMIPLLGVTLVGATWVGSSYGCGLQGAIRREFGTVTSLIFFTAVVATAFATLVADLDASAAALARLAHLRCDMRWLIAPLAGAMLLLIRSHAKAPCERVLAGLVGAFFGYCVSACFAHPDWRAVASAALQPVQTVRSDPIDAIAVVGTVLTSYVYVWQSIVAARDAAQAKQPRQTHVEALLGSVCAGAAGFFIIVACGASLSPSMAAVLTSADSAPALLSDSGPFAAAFFASALLASGILAMIVLTSTTTSCILEAFAPIRTTARDVRAHSHGVEAIVLACATAAAMTGIEPMRLLYGSSLAAGLSAPVTIVAFAAIMFRCGRRVRVPSPS
ncbi:MAG TPA: divalent metal cation transporter [Candidatus Limnocylindria bacterium]|nr:divalent metal cation transporter [Candidatus Limnocylindria bacterium]